MYTLGPADLQELGCVINFYWGIWEQSSDAEAPASSILASVKVLFAIL